MRNVKSPEVDHLTHSHVMKRWQKRPGTQSSDLTSPPQHLLIPRRRCFLFPFCLFWRQKPCYPNWQPGLPKGSYLSSNKSHTLLNRSPGLWLGRRRPGNSRDKPAVVVLSSPWWLAFNSGPLIYLRWKRERPTRTQLSSGPGEGGPVLILEWGLERGNSDRVKAPGSMGGVCTDYRRL